MEILYGLRFLLVKFAARFELRLIAGIPVEGETFFGM